MVSERGNRDFIASIVFLAYDDAISKDKSRDPAGARRFINPANDLFCTFCSLIDLDPDWVANGLQKKIADYDAQHPQQLVYKETYRGRKMDFQSYKTSREATQRAWCERRQKDPRQKAGKSRAFQESNNKTGS